MTALVFLGCGGGNYGGTLEIVGFSVEYLELWVFHSGAAFAQDLGRAGESSGHLCRPPFLSGSFG